MEPLYDVVSTWRERAIDVKGHALPAGHWIPEEVPDQLYDEIVHFFS
jgi:haloacetate dehalogenase